MIFPESERWGKKARIQQHKTGFTKDDKDERFQECISEIIFAQKTAVASQPAIVVSSFVNSSIPLGMNIERPKHKSLKSILEQILDNREYSQLGLVSTFANRIWHAYGYDVFCFHMQVIWSNMNYSSKVWIH